MDYEYNDARKPVSVLEGDGFYFDRILSRESSVGQSSRIYYRSTAEGVPFKWEMQPGTPKNPPENEVISPLNPPPAVQSMGLPRPCVDVQRPKGWSNRSRVWFWKKFKKSKGKESTNIASNIISSGRFERSEIGDSDKEFIASVLHNSSALSSSFSSSSSSRVPPPMQPYSRSRRDLLEGPFSCSPWNITAILSEVDENTYHSRDQKTVSALGWNGTLLFDRIDSRKSSMSHSSSRIYYDHPQSAEGVPFKWEMQPGTPNNVAVEEVDDPPPRPPSPPPAVQSLELPRPCIGQPKGGSKWSNIWLWIKEIKKTIKTRKFNNSLF